MSDNFYTIGKGCFRMADTLNGGQRDVGNTPGAEITIDVETLPHYESKTSNRVLDAEVTIEKNATVTVTIDEPKAENIAMFLLGTKSDASQTAGTGTTADVTVTELGLWYKIGKVDVSNVVVENAAQDTTYTLGTDYQIDASAGLVKALSGGGISAGDLIKVTHDHAARTQEKVAALTKNVIEKYVFFYGDSQAGVKQNIVGKASIVPNGSLSVINDGEWQTLALDLKFLDADDIDGLFEYNGHGVTGD